MYNRFLNYFNTHKSGFNSSYNRNGINFDYIATISKKSNDTEEVVYNQYPITFEYSNVLEKLKQHCNDDDKTVLDLHEFCVLSIPEYTNRNSFSCCLPYEYSCSYISNISEIPTFLMYGIENKEKYKTFLEDLKTEFVTKSLSEYSINFEKSQLTTQEYHEIYSSNEKRKEWEAIASKKFHSIDELPFDEKSEKIKNELENFELKQQNVHKHVYIDLLEFWLLAAKYFDTLKRILEDDNVCMYSLENVGWHSYTYPVHGDFEFQVNTNFCYGSVSYYYIIVKYKGILILPYSHIVSYYHANMVSFLSSTRCFYPERCNWEHCFKYVVELINEASLDEGKFIEKWVKKELQTMIDGLKSIMEQPYTYLEDCLRHPLDEQKKDKLVSVRNMNDEETSHYKIYRDEMVIAFQAEKITDSICIIDNLRQLSTVMPEVQSTIEIIINLNKAANPIFKEAISSIENEIERRKLFISKQEERLCMVKKVCDEYDTDCRMKWSHLCNKENLEYEQFKSDFIKENKEYEDLLAEGQNLTSAIKDSKDDIENRKRFMTKLKDCTKKIDKFLSL